MGSKLVAVAAMLAFAGCGDKEEEDTGPIGFCSDMGTTALSEIPVEDWPSDLGDHVEPYELIPGVYTADACGLGPINVKFDILPLIDNVSVVTTPVDPALPCGCRIDEGLEGSDNALGAYAYAYGGTAYFGDLADKLNPAVDESIFQMDWAFLPASTGYLFRGCGAIAIPGEYSAATAAIRITPAGLISGTLEATGGEAEPYRCELTNFVLVTND